MVQDRLRDFVISSFMFDAKPESLEDNTSFLERGIVDSTGVMELVAFVEAEFRIEVEDAEIVPENFDSISNLCHFLESKGVKLAQV